MAFEGGAGGGGIGGGGGGSTGGIPPSFFAPPPLAPPPPAFNYNIFEHTGIGEPGYGLGAGQNGPFTPVPHTVTNTPNYGAMVDSRMGPYEALAAQQQAAAAANASKRGGFAQSQFGLTRKEYGIQSAAAKAAHTRAKKNILNVLAARGLYNSGARGVRQGLENQRYSDQSGIMSIGLERAQTQLQQYLYGLQSSLEQQRLAQQAQLAQQRMSLGDYLAQLYPATTTTQVY